jgi:hypothetical protein
VIEKLKKKIKLPTNDEHKKELTVTKQLREIEAK